MGNEQILTLKGLWLNSIICQDKSPATAKEGNTPKKEKKTPTKQQKCHYLNPKERKKERQLQRKSVNLVTVLELTACLGSERRLQTLP